MCRTGIGKEDMKVGGVADAPTGNHAKLAVINDRDSPLRMSNHRGVDLSLIRVIATETALRADTVSANEKRGSRCVKSLPACQDGNRRYVG